MQKTTNVPTVIKSTGRLYAPCSIRLESHHVSRTVPTYAIHGARPAAGELEMVSNPHPGEGTAVIFDKFLLV